MPRDLVTSLSNTQTSAPHASATSGWLVASLFACAMGGCTVTTTVAKDPEPAAAPLAPTAPTSAPPATDPANPPKLPVLAPPASPGDWHKPNPNGKADGDACTKPDDCKSGVCDGQGCDAGPKCVAADRMCTRDAVIYCGCDGKSFTSSGSCAGRPYKSKGACN